MGFIKGQQSGAKKLFNPKRYRPVIFSLLISVVSDWYFLSQQLEVTNLNSLGV